MFNKFKLFIFAILFVPNLIYAQRGTNGWYMNEGDDISILFWIWVIFITILIPYSGYQFFKEAESFYEKFISFICTISFGVFWINLLGFVPFTSDAAWFIAGIFGQSISLSYLIWGLILFLISLFILRKLNQHKLE